MSESLSAAERETIVNWTEADENVTVWTAQRSLITRLRKLPAFIETRSGFYGTTAWAEFVCPVEDFRVTQKRVATALQRETARQRALTLNAPRSA